MCYNLVGMNKTLSVVINAQNVEKDLENALSSVRALADEVVVVDQGSTDNTRIVAGKFGAKVFDHKSVPYVEIARNFAISKAGSDWILILDPDEEVSPILSKKVKEVIEDNKADFFRIPRKNIVFGKWLKYSRWWPDYNIRLFKKGSVTFTEDIHQPPVTSGVGVDIDPTEEFAIIHHHYTSIDEYLERMSRYTTVQANSVIAKGYKFTWTDLIRKPSSEFLSRYFFGKGYKDGVHGLALSLLQGFSELIVYLKIWQNNKFEEKKLHLSDIILELKKIEKDFHYWYNDTLVNENKSFIARIKRKLRI